MVYYIEKRSFYDLTPQNNRFDSIPIDLYHQDKTVAETYAKYNSKISSFETVCTIKLRIQEDMGIPANCLTVYCRVGDERNPRTERT